LHGGDSLTSLVLNDDTDRFKCFVCGESGDKLTFIQKLYDCDFKAALRFFGLEPGKIPKPDPAALKKARIESAINLRLSTWTRRIRRLLFDLNETITLSERRLLTNPDDNRAWLALSIAYKAYAPLEHMHDQLLSRSDADRASAYKQLI
jgi:hypothetical protein